MRTSMKPLRAEGDFSIGLVLEGEMRLFAKTAISTMRQRSAKAWRSGHLGNWPVLSNRTRSEAAAAKRKGPLDTITASGGSSPAPRPSDPAECLLDPLAGELADSIVAATGSSLVELRLLVFYETCDAAFIECTSSIKSSTSLAFSRPSVIAIGRKQDARSCATRPARHARPASDRRRPAGSLQFSIRASPMKHSFASMLCPCDNTIAAIAASYRR